MSQKNTLKLARQGDPNAIATLINRNLNPKGITAKVRWKNKCLRVLLESDEVPNQEKLVKIIQNGIVKLGIAEIQVLQVFGRQKGDEIPVWTQTINLEPSFESQSSNLAQEQVKRTEKTSSQKNQASIPHPQSKSSSAAQHSNSASDFGIDAANPGLLLVGCLLVGLILSASNVIIPIFLALLALGPALLASNKGRKPLNWWCYGFLLFLVAIFHAAFTPAIPERANKTELQFWKGVKYVALAFLVFCFISYQFTEEGSKTRGFLGISGIASLVMSIVAWTQTISLDLDLKQESSTDSAQKQVKQPKRTSSHKNQAALQKKRSKRLREGYQYSNSASADNAYVVKSIKKFIGIAAAVGILILIGNTLWLGLQTTRETKFDKGTQESKEYLEKLRDKSDKTDNNTNEPNATSSSNSASSNNEQESSTWQQKTQQKSRPEIVEAVCSRGNVISKDDQLACGSCPNIVDTDWQDSFQLEELHYGSYTRPNTREAYVDFSGCEPHASNFGGSVLLRQQTNGWQTVRYDSGFRSHTCDLLTTASGRDKLVCQGKYMGQGYEIQSMNVFDIGSNETQNKKLFSVRSNVGTCHSPFYQNQITDWILSNENQDQWQDLVVTISSAAESPQQQPSSQKSCEDPQLPEPTQHRLVFLFNGERLEPTPKTSKILKQVNSY